MKPPTSLLALAILFLTAACIRPVSTAQPDDGSNPFTPVAGPRLCAAADLQASSNAHEAPDSLALGVTLVNQSGTRCGLQNPPQVTVDGLEPPPDVRDASASAEGTPSGQGAPAGTLIVSPGESAVLILAWRNYCGEMPGDGPTLHLTLSEEETVEINVDTPTAPRCEDTSAPSTLDVNPYGYPP